MTLASPLGLPVAVLPPTSRPLPHPPTPCEMHPYAGGRHEDDPVTMDLFLCCFAIHKAVFQHSLPFFFRCYFTDAVFSGWM